MITSSWPGVPFILPVAPSPSQGLWPQIAFQNALGEPEMTSTRGIPAAGKSPHVPTGGTCDLGVRVGQAGKDSVTSLCRLQPRISRHKAEAAAGFPAGRCLGHLTSPRPARVLHLGPARPPKGATWVGRRGSPKPRTPYPQLSSGTAK